MKHFSIAFLRDWFGYTRRERRSTFILLIIIAVIAGTRFVVPGSPSETEMITLDLPVVSYDTLKLKQPQQGFKPRLTAGRNRTAPLNIDLNSCDSAALEELPGIGPVLSARIIKYRNLLGGYADVGQLREVYGLSEETFNIISSRVEADPSKIRKININTAEYKQIIRLPYFEKQEVNGIMRYRELTGKIGGIGDLVENRIITSEKAEKVKWYLEF